MSDSNSAERTAPRQTKVTKLLEKYAMDGFGDELERRWTGQDGERDSLRTLADVFNERLLDRVMTDAGMDPLDGEVENIYRLLTDDDVSSGTQTETETRLRQEGIDVDELRGEFVTYQAIRTYLKEVRDASHEQDTVASTEKTQSNFDRLIGRTTAVVEKNLAQLRRNGSLVLGKFRVQTTVTVYCEDCETQFEATALLKRGHCNCADENRK